MPPRPTCATASRGSASRLPATIDEPVVSKIEADAQAIIWIAVASDRQSPMEITDFADRYLTDPLKALPGVSSVIIAANASTPCGSGWIASGLAAQGLTVQDVENALINQNVESPGGRIESTQREFTVQPRTRPALAGRFQQHDHHDERLSDSSQGRRLRRSGSVRSPQGRARRR